MSLNVQVLTGIKHDGSNFMQREGFYSVPLGWRFGSIQSASDTCTDIFELGQRRRSALAVTTEYPIMLAG